MHKIYAITTVHNRSDSTRRCLNQLIELFCSLNLDYQILVVDDGSTDNTALMLATEFEDVIHVKGAGNLFWAGGMRKGFEYVSSKLTSNDYLIAFNDDSIFYLEVLRKDLQRYFTMDQKNIYCGVFHDSIGSISYGGRFRSSRYRKLKFSLQETVGPNIFADTLNFNFVVIPGSLIRTIGFLDSCFTHKYADFAFGMKAVASGYRISCSSKIIGTVDRNPSFEPLNFLHYVRWVIGVKEQPFIERFCYYRRYASMADWLFFLSPYVAIPFRYLLKVR